MPKQPLFPHIPGKRQPLFPHVPKGRQPVEKVTRLPQTKGITPEEWQFAEGMWQVTKEDAEKGELAGVYLWRLLNKYYPDNKDKQIRLMGFMGEVQEKYRGHIPREEALKLAKKWDVEKVLVTEMMEFLPQIAREWPLPLTQDTIDYLAKTEGDPLRKFCCRQCGECAPAELLEEGEFPERIAWLRSHYKAKHPGIWGKGIEKLPQVTIEGGEPVPSQYRDLVRFVDEPIPSYSLMTIEVEAGERKVDAVLKQLKAGVEGIQDSYQFRLFLTTMSKFHDYSIGNTILIMIQRRDATHVAGFNTWRELGRWVKKGETGIAILAPVLPPRPTCPGCGTKISRGARYCPTCGMEVEIEPEAEAEPRYFKVVYVFDISQTEGKPLPEFEVPVLTGEVNEELFARILALMKLKDVPVSFESKSHLDPAIKGQYSLATGIWVRPEEPRAQQLKSLLHEAAHYYSEGVFHIPRYDAETIAESAAFVVGAHYGFDTGVRSFPYVALWARDKKVLEKNLDAIRQVALIMLVATERQP